MTSPFPGMDPYLEGHLWPDVHQRLSTEIADLLTPQIAPSYVARLGIYTVTDDQAMEDVGIMYPDVAVFRSKAEEPSAPYYHQDARFTPATVSIPVLQTVEVRIPVVEIRDRDQNRLITAIEVLSPVNKRTPGLQPYRSKRQRLAQEGIHLLEIDLIRRGERPLQHPKLSHSLYLVTLSRAMRRRIDCWVVQLTDPLPVVPVPLQPHDQDAVLDLGLALRQAYTKARYDASLDYTQPPPPPALSEADATWLRQQIESPQAGDQERQNP